MISSLNDDVEPLYHLIYYLLYILLSLSFLVHREHTGNLHWYGIVTSYLQTVKVMFVDVTSYFHGHLKFVLSVLRAIYTVRLCRMRQAYDRPMTRIVSCKSNLQLAYDCHNRRYRQC